MNKLLIIGMVALLAGCNYYEAVEEGVSGSLDKTIYMVDGKPLECVSLHYRLSCNWEKHNKLFEGE